MTTTSPTLSNPIDFPPVTAKVTALGGVNYLVNGRHGKFIANWNDFYLGQALIRYGECCEVEWMLLTQIVRPGMLVVEVGANIGTHTVAFAKAVGLQGGIIAVEPQRIIHQYLCANISLNGLTNVETHHCGCASHNGMMAVPPIDYHGRPHSNFGGVSLVERGKGEPVPVRLLDDIVGPRKTQLIKIDVEGMEEEVLRGAKHTIKNNRPILYVENDRLEKSESLIRLIQHYKYRLYWHLPPLYNPQNFFGVAENAYGNTVSCNMLCIPEEVTMNLTNFLPITDPTDHPAKHFAS